MRTYGKKFSKMLSVNPWVTRSERHVDSYNKRLGKIASVDILTPKKSYGGFLVKNPTATREERRAAVGVFMEHRGNQKG